MTIKQAQRTAKSKIELVKHEYPRRPEFEYLLPKYDKKIATNLAKAKIFGRGCPKACTEVITLLPKTTVQPSTGIGYFMVNVDGWRTINAYVICDPLNSSTQRGFSLELSFSLVDFVLGVGVLGETSFFYNFESYYNPALNQKLLRCETADLTIGGGLPWIGGVDLTHILRAPVMGPFVRASVFNEGTTARGVEVKAYLST
jgi:hypothetical protein